MWDSPLDGVVGHTEEEWDAEEEEGAPLVNHGADGAPPAKNAKARRCRLTVSKTTQNCFSLYTYEKVCYSKITVDYGAFRGCL